MEIKKEDQEEYSYLEDFGDDNDININKFNKKDDVFNKVLDMDNNVEKNLDIINTLKNDNNKEKKDDLDDNKLIQRFYQKNHNNNEVNLYYYQILLLNARGIFIDNKIEFLKKKYINMEF